MSTLHRWTNSIMSSFERVIAQIENHEALIASAIQDVQQAGTRASGQLERVKRDGQQMRQRIIELRDLQRQWEVRAKKVALLDQSKAIECLRRRQSISIQLTALESQERKHSSVEKHLQSDLSKIQDKLIALRQQRNILRTRQSRAEAMRIISLVDSEAVAEIDDIFEHWNIKLAECENQLTLAHGPQAEDELAATMHSAEEDEELHSLLRQLLAEDENKSSN